MQRNEFLAELTKRLAGLEEAEVKKSVDFYSEVILDAMETGKSEEEAVASLGSIKDIADSIYGDTPFHKLIKGRVKKEQKKTSGKALNITLLVLGFPLWFPLLVTALALLFVAYILLWVMAIVIFALVVSFVVAGVACVIAGIISLFAQPTLGLMVLGAGLVLTGLGVLAFYPGIIAAKALINMTGSFIKSLKTKIFGGNRHE